jgi:membrane protease YdiL (CAAX protease family)
MKSWNGDTVAGQHSTSEEDRGDPQTIPQLDGNTDLNPEGFGQSFETYREMFPRRIPNFGHALLFVSFAGMVLVICQLILFAMGMSPAGAQGGVITIQHPKLQLAALAATYLTTLLMAWLFFPVIWQRSFLDGVSWHWATARRQAGKLLSLGLLLGAGVQIVTYFVTTPKSSPIDNFFSTPWDAWLITLFGTIVAPVFEEICFRGFLVPAFAIAFDWLRLPRTPEAREHWQTTTTLTPAALIFSAIMSSVFFAWLHAEQVSHVSAILFVLFSVSLVLTFVRVRTQSVASSAIVHGAYNFFVFFVVMIQTGGYRHLERITQ